MELADVIIEVLDARDPLPCRSQEVENFVRSSGAEKRIILLLNKIGESLSSRLGKSVNLYYSMNPTQFYQIPFF